LYGSAETQATPRGGDDAVLRAFDLLELDGHDLRRAPIGPQGRAGDAAAPARREDRLQWHHSGDGAIIYRHACALGEGIVSKRLGSPYRFGRAVRWLKIKNPAAPAVTR
jgi:bifunctional non-homologous end joining protein LigD